MTKDGTPSRKVGKVPKIRIGTLPSGVIAKLRSTVQITSLQDVVIELLKNALDAEASQIAITVDLERGFCTVEDDGCGFPGRFLRTARALNLPYCEQDVVGLAKLR